MLNRTAACSTSPPLSLSASRACSMLKPMPARSSSFPVSGSGDSATSGGVRVAPTAPLLPAWPPPGSKAASPGTPGAEPVLASCSRLAASESDAGGANGGTGAGVDSRSAGMTADDVMAHGAGSCCTIVGGVASSTPAAATWCSCAPSGQASAGTCCANSGGTVKKPSSESSSAYCSFISAFADEDSPCLSAPSSSEEAHPHRWPMVKAVMPCNA
mmetsp:Transcript_111769/g.360818  ORF Transcript_111769/g.360818 Transcript_111769/m.360818 type:complete len:215 (-) Transcript_111769:7-651(-)